MPQNEAVLESPAMDLNRQLSGGRFDLTQVATFLDGLDRASRLVAARRRLFDSRDLPQG